MIYIKQNYKCDIMTGVRQADDPFFCFGAKPDKGFGLEISGATGSSQGNASERRVWRRETLSSSWQSRLDSRRDQSA